MTLLDTSAVVSFFITDKHTEKAEHIFQNVFDGDIEGAITDLILVEVCGVLRRRANKESAEITFHKLNSWIESGMLQLLHQNEDVVSLACTFAIQYGIKGADALIAATADYYGMKLVTFDEEVREKLTGKIKFYP